MKRPPLPTRKALEVYAWAGVDRTLEELSKPHPRIPSVFGSPAREKKSRVQRGK
jgi:hypothetical protein